MPDLERAYEWVNDAEVTRHLNVRYPWSLAAEEAWLRERTSKPLGFDSVHFAIEVKDGTHIGTIGFQRVHPENRKARLGISIGDKRYWSQGFGTDAMLTMLRFGFEQMNLHRIDLLVDADNERAIACYGKCGMLEEGRFRGAHYQRGRHIDQLVMGILRDEYYAKWGRSAPAGA
jgi:RimJ/RimL family protein N-acetyltransferase